MSPHFNIIVWLINAKILFNRCFKSLCPKPASKNWGGFVISELENKNKVRNFLNELGKNYFLLEIMGVTCMVPSCRSNQNDRKTFIQFRSEWLDLLPNQCKEIQFGNSRICEVRFRYFNFYCKVILIHFYTCMFLFSGSFCRKRFLLYKH